MQSSCHPRAAEKNAGEVVFYGEGGTMGIGRDGWTIFDQGGKETGKGKGAGGGDAAHIGNFLNAIRGKAKLNSTIAEGQKSSMM